MNRIFAFFVAAGLALSVFSIHASPDQFQKKAPQKTIALKGPSSSCVGTHSITQCISAGACVTSDCPSGEYCIPPQAVAPAKPTTIKKAQCVNPDAIGEITCADSGSKKMELVVKGVTVPLLEKCPQDKPICLLNQCVAKNKAACIDSDNTNYSKLFEWSKLGNKQGKAVEPSVKTAGTVKAINANAPNVIKEYKDKCKGSSFLLEQACNWGVAKEVGINCGDVETGAICLSDNETAKCEFKAKDSDADGIPDINDNCVNVPNTDQLDSDEDSVGDVCDNCLKDWFNDIDGDKICAEKDNCPWQSNPDQTDVDNDGYGDVCEYDFEPSVISVGGSSVNPSISADGRYVSFESYAKNLVAEDNNWNSDIFIHDRKTGKTERVSISSVGVEGNGNSANPSINADGRYVAFSSVADNLVMGDNNLKGDVFVHDSKTGKTERISVSSDGVEGNDDTAYMSYISADGRYVGFSSSASNLVTGADNIFLDAFVHDRETGKTELVNISSAGVKGSGSSSISFVSTDGRYVGVNSYASTLVAEDNNEYHDAFVRDRETGKTERVSVSSAGVEGNNFSSGGSISADGRYITFVSDASNLVVGDNNGHSDIFVRGPLDDPAKVKTVIVSVPSKE